MHPAQILINLHRAKQAGASDPFNIHSTFCEYTNNSCQGCPANGTCAFIVNVDPTTDWVGSLHTYCGDLINYTYEELLEAFPEYQI